MATAGPYEVHYPKPGHYAPGSCSIIARRPTPEETVLIAEMNTTVRNPWRPPADIDADARLLAASWDLLEACRIAIDDATISGEFVGTILTVDEHQFIVRAIDKAIGKEAADRPITTQTPAASALTPRELATVLAALREWQRSVINGPSVFFLSHWEQFQDGEHKPLDYAEIDALCERLNR